MASQRIATRVLLLFELLYTETDETHTRTTAEIVSRLHKKEIPCSRKTVSADIALLINFGSDIVTIKNGSNRYFMEGRLFELPEIRLLIDAVGSSRFVTAKKSGALIEKLKTWTSRPLAPPIQRHHDFPGQRSNRAMC